MPDKDNSSLQKEEKTVCRWPSNYPLPGLHAVSILVPQVLSLLTE